MLSEGRGLLNGTKFLEVSGGEGAHRGKRKRRTVKHSSPGMVGSARARLHQDRIRCSSRRVHLKRMTFLSVPKSQSSRPIGRARVLKIVDRVRNLCEGFTSFEHL